MSQSAIEELAAFRAERRRARRDRLVAFAQDNELSPEDMEAFAELAALKTIPYAKVRKAEAKKRGLNLREFDKVMDDYRRAKNADGGDEDGAVYRIVDGALTYMCPTKDGSVPIRLANFVARIEEDQRVDDGAAVERHWRLVAAPPLPAITVPVQDLTSGWWLKQWGASAVVTPAYERHLIAAIQSISEPRERVIYGHFGWRKLDGRWCYLSANGAVDAEGPVAGFEVAAGGELDHFKLPAVTDVKAAARASLGLLDFGPVGAALAAATYRAALGEFAEIAMSLFLEGGTGVFKSAIAGVAQAHWGTRFDGKHFPGNWASTANSLEKIAFVAKDSLITIDDFAPKGTSFEVDKLHHAADRYFRSAGNLGGRGRMNADSSLRATYWPRCFTLSSGEDVPRGASLRARLFIVHVQKGDVDVAKLTEMQRHAASGRLAEAMAAYVQWLAARAGGLSERLAARLIELRAEVVGDHRRTPDNVASLTLGIEMLLEFAESVGAIDGGERLRLLNRAKRELVVLAEAQDREQASENPVERFVDLIKEALSAGRAHLADKNRGGPPGDREEACGWRMRPMLVKEDEEEPGAPIWDPRGDKIGWIDDEHVYLMPAAAYAAAEALGKGQNRSLALNANGLARRLDEAKLLARRGTDRLEASLRAEGVATRGWCLSSDTLLPEVVVSREELVAAFKRAAQDVIDGGPTGMTNAIARLAREVVDAWDGEDVPF